MNFTNSASNGFSWIFYASADHRNWRCTHVIPDAGASTSIRGGVILQPGERHRIDATPGNNGAEVEPANAARRGRISAVPMREQAYNLARNAVLCSATYLFVP